MDTAVRLPRERALAALSVAALALGAIPYLLRDEPVWLVARVAQSVFGDARIFASTWAAWSVKTSPARHALGPWLMGHASDAALGIAVAAFVAMMQARSPRRTRLTWHGLAAAVLVALELAQSPRLSGGALGTFDPQDLAVLLLGYGLVVALTERGARLRSGWDRGPLAHAGASRSRGERT